MSMLSGKNPADNEMKRNMVYYFMADQFGFTPMEVDQMETSTVDAFFVIAAAKGAETERKVKKSLR